MFNYISTVLTFIVGLLLIAVGIAFITTCIIIIDFIREWRNTNEAKTNISENKKD